MCVLADPSVPQEKFTRTDPTFSHTHTHTLIPRIQIANISKSQSRRLPLASKKPWFYIQARNHPSVTHSCPGRTLKVLFSINSVQIIYLFVFTHWTPSVRRANVKPMSIYPLSLCSFQSILFFVFVQSWAWKLLIDIKSAAPHVSITSSHLSSVPVVLSFHRVASSLHRLWTNESVRSQQIHNIWLIRDQTSEPDVSPRRRGRFQTDPD